MLTTSLSKSTKKSEKVTFLGKRWGTFWSERNVSSRNSWCNFLYIIVQSNFGILNFLTVEVISLFVVLCFFVTAIKSRAVTVRTGVLKGFFVKISFDSEVKSKKILSVEYACGMYPSSIIFHANPKSRYKKHYKCQGFGDRIRKSTHGPPKTPKKFMDPSLRTAVLE